MKLIQLSKCNKGFSLIEIMVTISIFSVILVMSMGSIFTVLDANRKSQTLRAVMDNVNTSMEGMTRTIRFGRNYHCDSSGDLNAPANCSLGADNMTLRDYDGSQVTYLLSNNRIARRVNGGTTLFVTSPDVVITALTFRVFGANAYSNGADLLQPQVIIVVKGYSGIKPTSQSAFTLETTVSQRQFDFP